MARPGSPDRALARASNLKDPIPLDTPGGRSKTLFTLARHGLCDDALVKIIGGIYHLLVDQPRSKR